MATANSDEFVTVGTVGVNVVACPKCAGDQGSGNLFIPVPAKEYAHMQAYGGDFEFIARCHSKRHTVKAKLRFGNNVE